METRLTAAFQGSAEAVIAEPILRACVHCGFCNATCPTYQLLGDELDGPRGRIYQIKQVLEGQPATRIVQQHLDRCLTCRNCETTCPSGVQYGHLVEIGREVVNNQVRRPWGERVLHALLRAALTRPAVFGAGVRLGRLFRPLLPSTLRDKLPLPRPAGARPTSTGGARAVLLLRGCVQPAMLPSIDAATERVLHALGIETVTAPNAGCCGAIRHHLNDPRGALANLRTNIDAWWPYLESGRVETLVVNASGCTAMAKEYGHLLRDDPVYAERARRISACTQDITQFLLPHVDALKARLGSAAAHGDPARVDLTRVAVQTPCTLQHAQQLPGVMEQLLGRLGVTCVPVAESHLCCGSAGTYSLLQSSLARELRDRKLDNLQRASPDLILSDNIGCIAHLAAGTSLPVWHWIEWLDRALQP
jgi:glycolate dehydrogenase iron-sulfur subunit